MNEEILKSAGFAKEVEAVKLGRCPFCGVAVREEDFRDVGSLREFRISGLCQKCQDEVFGK